MLSSHLPRRAVVQSKIIPHKIEPRYSSVKSCNVERSTFRRWPMHLETWTGERNSGVSIHQAKRASQPLFRRIHSSSHRRYGTGASFTFPPLKMSNKKKRYIFMNIIKLFTVDFSSLSTKYGKLPSRDFAFDPIIQR